MKNMELLDMVKNYQSLLEMKEALAAQTKENNAAIEAAKAQIAQQMVDDDCPSIATGGYRFTLQEKTIYQLFYPQTKRLQILFFSYKEQFLEQGPSCCVPVS